jgi:drug/metabolite transporter (DMT)-like permease
VRARSPRLGYALAAFAATLWGLNGSFSRLLLDEGMPAARLAELRAVMSAVVLLVILAVARPRALKIQRADIPRFALLGIGGLALNNLLYFVSIHLLQVGVALTVEYLAPIWILLWLRLAYGRRMPNGVWLAAGLSLTGCFFVVRAYAPGSLDAAGLAAAVGAGISYAIYIFSSERLGHAHEAVTTAVYGFLFASLFWAIAQPLWTFPFHTLHSARHIGLALYVGLLGTLVPFACMFAAVRHVPAARAAVVATLEPVLAAAFAWAILGQTLSPAQIAGGALVIAAVVWIQVRAPAGAEETAPAYR